MREREREREKKKIVSPLQDKIQSLATGNVNQEKQPCQRDQKPLSLSNFSSKDTSEENESYYY